MVIKEHVPLQICFLPWQNSEFSQKAGPAFKLYHFTDNCIKTFMISQPPKAMKAKEGSFGQ